MGDLWPRLQEPKVREERYHHKETGRLERSGQVTATVALRLPSATWIHWAISAACWRLTRA